MRRAYSVWSVLTAIGAAGCAVVMIGQIFSLKRGGPTDHAFVLAALVLMMALAFYLIWLEYRDTRLLWLAALAGGGSLFNPGALSGLRQWRLQQLSGPLG